MRPRTVLYLAILACLVGFIWCSPVDSLWVPFTISYVIVYASVKNLLGERDEEEVVIREECASRHTEGEDAS